MSEDGDFMRAAQVEVTRLTRAIDAGHLDGLEDMFTRAGIRLEVANHYRREALWGSLPPISRELEAAFDEATNGGYGDDEYDDPEYDENTYEAGRDARSAGDDDHLRLLQGK